MISQLETQIDNARRRMHAPRVAFAAACVLRQCGVKVSFPKPKRPGMTRTGVYEIDGVTRKFHGVSELSDWLFNRGIVARKATLTHWLGEGVATVGDYTIRRVGVAKRVRTKWGKA